MMLSKALGRIAAGAAMAAALIGSAAAGPVTLRSYDGAVAISGDLVEFTGDVFVLRTTIGDLRINAMQVACEGEGCPDPSLLRSEFAMAGSDEIGATLMPALLLAYADSLDADLLQSREGDSLIARIRSAAGADLATVTIREGESEDAFKALLAGDAAIGMSARPVSDAELAALRAAGAPDITDPAHERIIALDGLVVVVAPSNPIDALSQEDIADIFAGEITNWSELGGPDAPIVIYAPEGESSARAMFEENILQPLGLSIGDGAKLFENDGDLADQVALDPNGIGFVSIASVRAAKPVAIRTECGLIATPDPFGIKTEEYPLARRLYLYTKDETLPPHAKQLLAFAQSTQAQPVIADAGYVDQGIESRTINEQGMRFAMAFTDPSPEFRYGQMRELATELLGAERLSATFRFNPGSSQLDNKAQRDVKRVIEYLSQPTIGEKEVLLIGFTDSVGRADLNRALSFRRADQVRAAIEAAAPAGALDKIDFRVMGYGELAPVGCNESLAGRRINRRVELWIRDKF
ncbi:phosphate ABC transporter substrate-binding protein (PhoT family) [Oceanicella actignis]|nr:phosphate ABC transporter substrate-binding protein (PhoT family) [Oceanicella actignis]